MGPFRETMALGGPHMKREHVEFPVSLQQRTKHETVSERIVKSTMLQLLWLKPHENPLTMLTSLGCITKRLCR
jgi:hypothetical protein